MNIRHYLACLLAVLIAMQSVTAMADIHQFHQLRTEHLSFTHEHEPSKNASIKATDVTDSSSNASQDCEHCCHCHGIAYLYLGGNPDNLELTTLDRGISDYHFIYHSFSGTPDTPPPIG